MRHQAEERVVAADWAAVAGQPGVCACPRPRWEQRLPSWLVKAIGSALLAVGLIVTGLVRAESIDVGTRRELFVDDLLIERLTSLTVRLHEPRPAGVAIRYDLPHEDPRTCFYTTVLKDGDRFRMYYRAARPAEHHSMTCYAESRDGIVWVKPEVGVVEVNGSSRNNVILFEGDTFCPFIDDRPGVPAEERYKANVEVKEGLVGFVSSDGIRWRRLPGVLVPRSLPNHFDSQNVMFWSAAEGRYVLLARYMVGGDSESAGGIRATARATSPDFRTWSPPVSMTYGDTGSSRPSQHLYVNQTTPYFRAPHLYLSLAARFQRGRRALSEEQAAQLGLTAITGGAEDISDTVLLTSRAGSATYDFIRRESFIRPGLGASHWVSRANYAALGVLPTGPAEISFYVQRNYGQRSAFLERLTLRTDGFASVRAGYEGGELLTKPLRFDGRALEVNLSTSAAGGLRVEVQDADGRPIPGFALADSEELIGDEIERIVSWRGSPDLGSLRGKTICLRFVLRDADLYSLRFR